MGDEVVEGLVGETFFQRRGVQQGFQLIRQVFSFVGFAFGPDEAFDGGRQLLAAMIHRAAHLGAGFDPVFDDIALGVAGEFGLQGEGLADGLETQ